MKNEESVFYNQWNNAVTNLMNIMYPEKDKDKVSALVKRMADDRIKDSNVRLHNNYVDKEFKLGLLKLYNWIDEKKPILSESGVLFKNQDQSLNPNAKMLRAQRDSRDENKKKMYQYDYGTPEFEKYNILQQDDKVDSNSFYGGSGAPSCIFYNIYIASSTTLKGRNLITTAAMSFENFLANNVLFHSFDECMVYIGNIVGETYQEGLIDEDMISTVTLEKVYDRLVNKFAYDINEKADTYLQKILTELTPEQLTKVYYKNNLYEFITNTKKGKSVATHIVNKIVNGDDFMNPEKPPKDLIDPMSNLWDMCRDMVFYKYVIPDRFERLEERMIRKSVVVVDTDSNMLNMTKWINTLVDNFDITRDNRVEIVNVCAYLSTAMIREHLDLYCDSCNVLPRFYKVIDMKNEYHYKRMMLTLVKKRYAGMMERKEEKLLEEGEADLKGLTISKTETNEFTSERLKKILIEDILEPDVIDPAVLLNDMEEFENDVADAIKNGNPEVLKPTSVKPLEAYKNPDKPNLSPYRMQGIRGVIAWNYLYPGKAIQPPVSCYLIYLNITEDMVDDIKKKHPREGQIIDEKIFNNPNEDIAHYGMSVICMPKNIDKIPDWMIEYIDINKIVQNNASAFNNPMKSIGFLPIYTKGSKETFGNIIPF